MSFDNTLDSREIEVIRWLAAGKSLKDTSEITGIPYRSVRFYLERARRRYGYATNIQTIVQAAKDYQLDPLHGETQGRVR